MSSVSRQITLKFSQESFSDSDSDSKSETLWGTPSSSSDKGSSTVIWMSHGNRPVSYGSRRCSNFKLVWVCTRRSTRCCLFLLFEWIQSSIDQICSHTETEQDRSTTLRSREWFLFTSKWILFVDDSSECLLFEGNPGDHLGGVIKTITKEGFIPPPSLKTATVTSCVISLIFPMFWLSMNLSSFGISFVVKKVWCDSVVSLTPPGLVLI